ncbi:predicted protein [Histoplasma capsulatum G186AR]|uniref:Uncharacterized protein n=1 Tax=Ajellomyces capsulatus (strain G186AR / H82 / ATCC MYA-2454 / RMSCC 2432) TaxID=447093 RepID=C0NU12_AJECG|nr:uncharacterized protein HCBG_06642 [Histoplasma capsulatum G186AR]EEH05523.1 predicted protein [Histoplasma capsulatum G186AR]
MVGAVGSGHPSQTRLTADALAFVTSYTSYTMANKTHEMREPQLRPDGSPAIAIPIFNFLGCSGIQYGELAIMLCFGVRLAILYLDYWPTVSTAGCLNETRTIQVKRINNDTSNLVLELAENEDHMGNPSRK